MSWTRDDCLRVLAEDNKSIVERGEEPIPIPDSFTCDDCGGVDECEWAWDLYNTNGDCLAEK